MRFLAAGMDGLSRGVRAEMSFGYGRESQGYAAGPPGNVFMNRLNFEKTVSYTHLTLPTIA